MRHGYGALGALALACLTLAACASDRPGMEGETSEAEAAAVAPGMAAVTGHPRPTINDGKPPVTNPDPGEGTRPQTDPWSPSPLDSAGLRDRPQTDPWQPRPLGSDPVR